MNEKIDNCKVLNIYILSKQVNWQIDIMAYNCFIISMKSKLIFLRKTGSP